ncbi:polymorphic toxin-type HINT domain-containing protein [Streptomyces althioticus]
MAAGHPASGSHLTADDHPDDTGEERTAPPSGPWNPTPRSVTRRPVPTRHGTYRAAGRPRWRCQRSEESRLKHLVKVVIDTDGDKGEKTAEVTATDGHPFWVPELGQWLDATDLQPGQWLQTSAGTHVQITAIERWTTPGTTVHNLTVSDTHTYYVLAGATPVLVHNCGTTEDDAWLAHDGAGTAVDAE